MTKCTTTICLLLAGTIAASAGESVTYQSIFTCYPSVSSKEADPVVRILVGHFNRSNNTKTTRITHFLASGSERDRGNQYFDTNVDVRETKGFIRLIWTGRLKTNPHVTITGNLTAGGDHTGTYTESWFHDGKFTNKMTASCALDTEASGKVEPAKTGSNFYY